MRRQLTRSGGWGGRVTADGTAPTVESVVVKERSGRLPKPQTVLDLRCLNLETPTLKTLLILTLTQSGAHLAHIKSQIVTRLKLLLTSDSVVDLGHSRFKVNILTRCSRFKSAGWVPAAGRVSRGVVFAQRHHVACSAAAGRRAPDYRVLSGHGRHADPSRSIVDR